MRRLTLAFLLLGAAPAFAADLTLKRVMLSSAGVGYFEYEAEVDGPTTLGLDVPLDQVDDVLTSLVVFDSAGGVGTVELPGRNNTRASFGDVPFGPEALRSTVDYLNSLQGVEIAVQGPRPMTGRLVHAERVAEALPVAQGQPQATVQRTRVTLLGTDGMRQFVLEEADSIQVTDPALSARIGQALDSLRREVNQSVRHITLRSTGAGQRTVLVGYVAAAPLWKATYRLMLPAKDGDPARMQGWAVLENQSGADWDKVGLTLQYGNPVTFWQAIYQSYFVQRPEVPVEILGRILPSVDTRARPAEVAAALKAAPLPPAGARGFAAAPAPARAGVMAPPAEPAQVAESVEETIYQLPTPVVLAAGHTASVPIIDHGIPAERLDLAAGDDPHPLSAIRITNDTGTSLPAGVLTLYDTSGAATFAGDARLGGLPAGEQRLLSFAQDLRTTVERQSTAETSLASLTAAEGVAAHHHPATRGVARHDHRTGTRASPRSGGNPQGRRSHADAGRRRRAQHRADGNGVARSGLAGARRGAHAYGIHRPVRARTDGVAGRRCAGGGAAPERAGADAARAHRLATPGSPAAGRGGEAGDPEPAQGAAGGDPAGRGPHPAQSGRRRARRRAARQADARAGDR